MFIPGVNPVWLGVPDTLSVRVECWNWRGVTSVKVVVVFPKQSRAGLPAAAELGSFQALLLELGGFAQLPKIEGSLFDQVQFPAEEFVCYCRCLGLHTDL